MADYGAVFFTIGYLVAGIPTRKLKEYVERADKERNDADMQYVGRVCREEIHRREERRREERKAREQKPEAAHG